MILGGFYSEELEKFTFFLPDGPRLTRNPNMWSPKTTPDRSGTLDGKRCTQETNRHPSHYADCRKPTTDFRWIL